MKLRDMLLFTQELSDLLASGMTLGSALDTLSHRETTKNQDEIIRQLRDDIVQGTSLSAALKHHPSTFSSLYVSMVKAGEASGTLPEVLERLCYHYQRVQEAKEKVLMALIYPSIILLVGAATMLFTLVFVIPKFTAIFDELGGQLPFLTQVLVGISDFLLRYWWLLVLAGIGGWILFQRALKTDKGLRWWHGTLLKAPVIHQIVAANAFAHFARTLGALLSNGVPVLSALTIVEDTVGNRVIADEIREARDRVTDGATISGPLAESNVFPVLLTDMLAVGEQAGDMSGALAHIANRYDRELDRSVGIFTTVLEPIMILVMAAMVGFVAISMLMAVFDITSGLNL
jgi:type II secretory pathway component PulF